MRHVHPVNCGCHRLTFPCVAFTGSLRALIARETRTWQALRAKTACPEQTCRRTTAVSGGGPVVNGVCVRSGQWQTSKVEAGVHANQCLAMGFAELMLTDLAGAPRTNGGPVCSAPGGKSPTEVPPATFARPGILAGIDPWTVPPP